MLWLVMEINHIETVLSSLNLAKFIKARFGLAFSLTKRQKKKKNIYQTKPMREWHVERGGMILIAIFGKSNICFLFSSKLMHECECWRLEGDVSLTFSNYLRKIFTCIYDIFLSLSFKELNNCEMKVYVFHNFVDIMSSTCI